MDGRFIRLKSEIESELEEIKKIVEVIIKVTEQTKNPTSDFEFQGYIERLAFNLHSFYTGIERIFESIIKLTGEKLMNKSKWHQELLKAVSLNIPRIRPKVISKNTRNSLEDFMRFRHLVRNVYTFQLNPSRVLELAQKTPNIFSILEKDFNNFSQFLESMEED